MPDDHNEALRELEALLAGLPMTAPAAHAPAGAPADVVCSACHRLFPWDVVHLQAATMTFVCSDCLTSRLSRRSAITWSGVLRAPFTYVGLSVVLAAVLFAFGVGNPSRRSLAARDTGKPWHRREVARLAIRQAARAEARAERLVARGDDAQAIAWFGLTRRALGAAAASWRGMEAEVHARIGEAVMLGRAGDSEGCFRALDAMSEAVPPDHAARLAYLYHYGKAALSQGKVDTAARAWGELLTATVSLSPDNAYSKMIDQIIELAANDRRGKLLLKQVKAVCDTTPPTQTRRREVLEEMRSREMPLPGPVAQQEAERLRAAARAAERQPEKRPAGKKRIVIKHFE